MSQNAKFISLPVVCQNGHRAMSTYRFDRQSMELKWSAPPWGTCPCPKTDLGQVWRADGDPVLERPASPPSAAEVELPELDKEIERLRKVVQGIADADQSTWGSEYQSASEFKAWAQNICRHALRTIAEMKQGGCK